MSKIYTRLFSQDLCKQRGLDIDQINPENLSSYPVFNFSRIWIQTCQRFPLSNIDLTRSIFELQLLFRGKNLSWTDCVSHSVGPSEIFSNEVLISLVNGPVWSPMVFYGPIWSHMVLYGFLWSPMVSYTPIWSHMVPYGPIYGPLFVLYDPQWFLIVPDGPLWPLWSQMFLYGPIWSPLVSYVPVWSPMVHYGPLWSCMVL